MRPADLVLTLACPGGAVSAPVAPRADPRQARSQGYGAAGRIVPRVELDADPVRQGPGVDHQGRPMPAEHLGHQDGAHLWVPVARARLMAEERDAGGHTVG